MVRSLESNTHKNDFSVIETRAFCVKYQSTDFVTELKSIDKDPSILRYRLGFLRREGMIYEKAKILQIVILGDIRSSTCFSVKTRRGIPLL